MEHVQGTVYRFELVTQYGEDDNGSPLTETLNRLVDFTNVSAVYDDANGQVYILLPGKGFRVNAPLQEVEQAFLDARMGDQLNG